MESGSTWLQDLRPCGEMGARVAEQDWAATPLGPAAAWPPALRMAVTTALRSKFPMLVAWGPGMTQIYNDAFIDIYGERHPQLAVPLLQTWAELREVIGPLLDGVVSTREAVYFEDAVMWVERGGFPEEAYFTFSYSPLVEEDGAAGGVLVTAMETTQRVLDARRLGALGELAVATARAPNPAAVAREAFRALATVPEDLPFALAYLRDPVSGALELVGATGVPEGSSPAPTVLGEEGPWPAHLEEGPVLRTDLPGPAVVHELSGRPVEVARVLPLRDRGILVAGLSPSRRLDEHYERFLDLVASALTRAVDAADALDAERRRADSLAELHRAKTEFLQNVSHELRTPLTLVRAPLSDLLEDRERPLPPAQRAKVELVQRNSERLLRLVDGLLAFSRASADTLSPEPTDLAAATSSLAALFGPAAVRAACGWRSTSTPRGRR